MSHQRQPMWDFFSTLFGSTDAADCCIVFLIDPIDSESTGVGPRALGEPLPAHQLILRAGSERFRAYIERWAPAIADQAGTKRSRASCYADAEPNGAEEGPPRLRVRLSVEGEDDTASSCPDTRNSPVRLPEVEVLLNREDELQPVMAIVRFMYTGSVEGQQQEQQQGQGGRGDNGRKPEMTEAACLSRSWCASGARRSTYRCTAVQRRAMRRW